MIFGDPAYWEQWRKLNIPKSEPEEPEKISVDPVTGWRFGFLLGLGFEPDSALEMAFSRDVDLHRAEGLVSGGCPLETAVRILL